MTFRTDQVANAPVFNNIAEQSDIILILQPLFEEANRIRRTIVQLCRILSEAGCACAIPDLEGMGDNEVPASATTVARIESQLALISSWASRPGRRVHCASFRSGCLFDNAVHALSSWRFAPEPGDRLVRTLLRTEMADESDDTTVFVSGQAVARSFLDELSHKSLPLSGVVRTLRLATDRADADRHIEASPLWRHAEPGYDPDLAQVLADDILSWTKTCVVS